MRAVLLLQVFLVDTIVICLLLFLRVAVGPAAPTRLSTAAHKAAGPPELLQSTKQLRI